MIVVSQRREVLYTKIGCLMLLGNQHGLLRESLYLEADHDCFLPQLYVSLTDNVQATKQR